MEAERLQEASGDKLDEEAKAKRKKCAHSASSDPVKPSFRSVYVGFIASCVP